jgi:hypothetical protein
MTKYCLTWTMGNPRIMKKQPINKASTTNIFMPGQCKSYVLTSECISFFARKYHLLLQVLLPNFRTIWAGLSSFMVYVYFCILNWKTISHYRTWV